MAGYQQEYGGGLKENITTIFGLTIAAIGLSKASSDEGLEELQFSIPARKIYRKILLANNRIVGAVLLNRTKDAGILKSLIRNKKDISAWKDSIARTPLDMRTLLCSVTSP